MASGYKNFQHPKHSEASIASTTLPYRQSVLYTQVEIHWRKKSMQEIIAPSPNWLLEKESREPS